MKLPVCYTFRRCPYAIRARMAIYAAELEVEYREIVFSDKPASMLEVSPKGTVPVLHLENGLVIDESWDVMLWALSKNDPQNLLPEDHSAMDEILQLVVNNDGEFKANLDRYKYSDRYPEKSANQHRTQGEVFLQHLDDRLRSSTWLVGNQIRIVDYAVFPFVRQFSMVDPKWFASTPYEHLKIWLGDFLEGETFKGVMKKLPVWQSSIVSL